MSLPQEIIASDDCRGLIPLELMVIIKEKMNSEYEMKIKVFEDCIIPYIYRERNGEPKDEQGNMVGNLWAREGTWFATTFTLTAIKRTCSRFKKDVSIGHAYPAYDQVRYLTLKNWHR